MTRIIAYCGTICTDCPAYTATQANDYAALEQVAAQWCEEFNTTSITVESIICDGCLGKDGRHCSFCFECEIRACGIERGIVNCAYCADYTCKKIEGYFDLMPDARGVLDGIRQSLN